MANRGRYAILSLWSNRLAMVTKMNYIVMLTTKATPKKLGKAKTKTFLVIQPQDYTNKQISDLRAAGYTLLGYLSAGSISDQRSYYKQLKPYRLSKLQDWPHQYYLDLRKPAVRDFIVYRARELKNRGFQGWWLDNLDVYEYHKSTEMYNGIITLLKRIRAIDKNSYIMINGGSQFLDKLMDKDSSHKTITYIDGVTQEEVYSLIKSYSGKGKFGQQKKDMHSWYKSHMKRILRHKMQAFLLEYTTSASLKARIQKFCKTYKMTGYYISSDVNL